MAVQNWSRRLFAGVGVGALVASFASLVGVGDAAAASDTANGSVRVYNYTRRCHTVVATLQATRGCG